MSCCQVPVLITRSCGVTEEWNFGHCFGEAGLARGDRFRIRVRSVEATTVLFLARDAFRELTRRGPKLGRRLLNNLLNHIGCLHDELLADAECLTEYGVWQREHEEHTQFRAASILIPVAIATSTCERINDPDTNQQL
jgi:CRP-like cAMP-binding protein